MKNQQTISKQNGTISLPHIYSNNQKSFSSHTLSNNVHTINSSVNTSQNISSLQNLNSTYQLAMKSKSPSCKNIFGEALTKKKIPISSLSVTKYQQLLAVQENDPKHPDITLHIPVDSNETKNYIKAQLQSQAGEPNKNQQKVKSKYISESLNDLERSKFIPFKNSKEINKQQFIKLHQENPSFQNLDFHELFLTTGEKMQTTEKQQKLQNKINQQLKNDQNNEESSSSDEDNDYGINFQNGFRRIRNGKQVSSSQSLGQRPLNKIELSLVHNKDIHHQLNRSLLFESWNSYSDVQQRIKEQQDVLKRMPKIRQYPIFKNKKLTSMQGSIEGAQNNNEESKENNLPSTNRAIGSTKQINIKNANNNAVSSNQQNSESDPLNNKFNEEDEKKVRFLNSVSGNYSVYWYSFEQNHWKPDIRECQSLIVEGKKGYLFGGVGKELYNTIVELDLETFKWQEVKTSQMNGNIPSARFGHSCNLYKKNLIFFGGEYRQTQNQIKFRDCLLDVYSYNLETRTWKYITCTGGPLQPRRNHASCIIGRNLLVHGGVNNKDQSLRDMWFLDLGTQTWSESVVNGEFESSYHKCVPVYHSQRCGKINIYKAAELKVTKWGANIQQEGVYFFGGKNTKGEILGDLKILRTDVKPMQWIKPETKGVGPKNRYGHTMEFSQEFNFIVIHGGKNDNEPEVYFSDLFLFNVDDFNWIKIQVHGRQPYARFNHSSSIYESKLVVFGGINLDGFLQPHVSVLELDNVIAGKMQEREDNQLTHQLSGQRYSNADEKDNKKSMKNNSHNIKFEYIPFSERIKELESELDEQKILVNQLSFHNFKSFLPIPRFPTQPYSRVPNKRNTFLKQNINIDQQTNTQIKTPTNESQKKISYE
ncbi:hypothetical protein ABPG74_004297 [Tetrahymena malaccensis]